MMFKQILLMVSLSFLGISLNAKTFFPFKVGSRWEYEIFCSDPIKNSDSISVEDVYKLYGYKILTHFKDSVFIYSTGKQATTHFVELNVVNFAINHLGDTTYNYSLDTLFIYENDSLISQGVNDFPSFNKELDYYLYQDSVDLSSYNGIYEDTNVNINYISDTTINNVFYNTILHRSFKDVSSGIFAIDEYYAEGIGPVLNDTVYSAMLIGIAGKKVKVHNYIEDYTITSNYSIKSIIDGKLRPKIIISGNKISIENNNFNQLEPSLFDMRGRLIKQFNLSKYDQQIILTNSISSGNYLFVIKTNSGIITKKVIVK